MMRALLAVIACLSLTGCWASEHRIFGPGDWAHVDFSGKYKRENANGDAEASVVLTTRPDGLIVGVATDLKDHTTERTVMGLVPIRGGSGKYFLAVDRTAEKDTGETYLVAHLTDDKGLDLFWPDCDGTAPIQGMVSEKSELTNSRVCTFSTKAALMAAGLQAETFLAAKHPIAVGPLGRLVPDDGSAENSIDVR
jgi:hypothetical protein